MKLFVAALVAASLLAGCTPGQAPVVVAVDGSSTVFPITEAMAEEFQKSHPNVRVTVGISGTGGGFKKFCVGETDINDASRPIKGKEVAKATENQLAYIELPVAFDGISVVANPKNDFCQQLTVEQLKKIWAPESKVARWSDVDPSWPARPIKLYGPGTDSGTFDYFTETINGESGACRSDFQASEDDNVLVRGIAGDQDSLGFFGFAYYAENKDKLKIIPIVTPTGPVVPSQETINNGTYTPLSRPLFIYVGVKAAARIEVKDFVEFYLDQAPILTKEVGYVPLPTAVYKEVRNIFDEKRAGSRFSGRSTQGVPLIEVVKSDPETRG